MKLSEAEKFVRAIECEDILFAGVSGSVSYTPDPEDDIDIYLIVRENRLWTEMFRAFIIRRLLGNRDICLSLNFDHRFALQYYGSVISGLPVRDSINAVPLKGKDYYESLLSSSPEIRRVYPDFKDCGPVPHGSATRARPGPVELFSFIILASWLYLKNLIANRSFEKRGEFKNRFRTVARLHAFYLETEKYAELNRSYLED
ncbi:MAG: hypothetical protein QW597_02475 [Thermoplasmataceae archaeon]